MNGSTHVHYFPVRRGYSPNARRMADDWAERKQATKEQKETKPEIHRVVLQLRIFFDKLRLCLEGNSFFDISSDI